MDDLTNQLNKILSDPQSMAQIESIMGSLGLNNSQNNEQNNNQNDNQNNEYNNSQNQVSSQTQSSSAQQNSNFIPNSDMINMLSSLAPLLNQMKTEDNSTRLLTALKPMISDERGTKVDQALKILQLMKVFPMLKDSGMLSNILGGLF